MPYVPLAPVALHEDLQGGVARNEFGYTEWGQRNINAGISAVQDALAKKYGGMPYNIMLSYLSHSAQWTV